MRGLANTLMGLMITCSWGCESTQDNSAKLHDGRSANYLREKLGVPIIDSNMIRVKADFNSLTRWESKDEIPTDGLILHSWKNIELHNESKVPIEEIDGFRLKINDSVGHQINIFTKLNGNSVINRSGELWIYPLRRPNSRLGEIPNRIFNESQTDSIFKSWKLDYLIQDK